MGSRTVIGIVVALCLCLAGAFVSGLLLQQHHGEAGAVATVNAVCGDGQTSGCEEVASSAWSSFAGWPVAGYGLVFYLALTALLAFALLAPGELRGPLGLLAVLILLAGLLVDLGLLALQAFVIHAWCHLCLLTYVLSALAAVALVPAARLARGQVRAALQRSEARLALGGWVLSVLAIVGLAVATDALLATRAEDRQRGLLGAPAPPATTATPPAAPAAVAEATPTTPPPIAAPPAGADQATFWRERAQQLQATLDDPRKLETYFTEKARLEFDSAKAEAIDLSDITPRGPAAAPVKVVEYSDFLCPFCRNLGLALAQFVPQAGGRVAVYFKNYPLDTSCNPKLTRSLHPGACNLAMGAICAERQGRFEAFHDKVFATELRNPQPADVVRLAGEAGLDTQGLQACLADPKTRAVLDAQIEEANRLDVQATPTLYINGKKLPRINDFVATVDAEARKKGFPPLNP